MQLRAYELIYLPSLEEYFHEIDYGFYLEIFEFPVDKSFQAKSHNAYYCIIFEIKKIF